MAGLRPGQTLVDMSTAPVALARELAQKVGARGAEFWMRRSLAPPRPPVTARCRSWWGRTGAFARVRPLLACMGTEVTHCGAAGAGQAVKLMNNMVVAQTVVALAEALAVAGHRGWSTRVLFETLTKELGG